MQRKLIIHLNDDVEDDLMIIERVLELIKQGYSNGYEPFWELTNTPL